MTTRVCTLKELIYELRPEHQYINYGRCKACTFSTKTTKEYPRLVNLTPLHNKEGLGYTIIGFGLASVPKLYQVLKLVQNFLGTATETDMQKAG